MTPNPIPDNIPYMTLEQAIEIESRDHVLYGGTTETVRERLRLAALGMKLQAKNYLGLAGVDKMY